jgi:hypothetical protein
METPDNHFEDINKRTENTMHKERDTEAARELQDRHHEDRPEGDDFKYTSPDKYLALEQPGVTYTGDNSTLATSNSDHLEYDNNEEDSAKFKPNGENSRNADAFSQDDYILRDNLDLDEDQPNSISSDAPDRNTTDETL